MSKKGDVFGWKAPQNMVGAVEAEGGRVWRATSTIHCDSSLIWDELMKVEQQDESREKGQGDAK